MSTDKRNHASETVAAVQTAVNALALARIDAYATGEEIGAELDFAALKLAEVINRIRTQNTGTPIAVPTGFAASVFADPNKQHTA